MSDILYTVHDTYQGVQKIIDAEKGIQVGLISPRGKLVTPPIVMGDKVSFVVQTSDGSKLGTVHKLPSGALLTQFRA